MGVCVFDACCCSYCWLLWLLHYWFFIGSASCFCSCSQHQKGRTYFYSSFTAYFLGLVATIFVMHYFKHAQVFHSLWMWNVLTCAVSSSARIGYLFSGWTSVLCSFMLQCLSVFWVHVCLCLVILQFRTKWLLGITSKISHVCVEWGIKS